MYLGLFFWGLDQGAEVLALGADVVATLPTDASVMIAGLNAPPAPFVPERFHSMPGYALVVVGFGTEAEHAATVARVRTSLPPLFDFVTPMPYVQLQQMLDETYRWGLHCYEKGLYLGGLSDEAIAVVTEHQPRKRSPLSALLMMSLGAGYGAGGDDDTAFGGSRAARLGVYVMAVADNPKQLSADRIWVRSVWEALLPYALGSGSYVNTMVEFAEDRVRASYEPAKYERLARIKARYDPDNVFHLNANIKPAMQPI
ncbi:MAG TPA: BBE domain-containing protein [Pseudonocardiaceae bacterium]|nr:BBE domain-containing protein [Pseudonocardiaceae bacterium]